MAINFNALPTSNPGSLIPKGTYVANIDKAEMRTPKPKEDGTVGKDYLNLQLTLTDGTGKYIGKYFDKIFDSAADLMKFKLQRFVTALCIPITGDFELKDLAKIIAGKKFIVDITINDKGAKPESTVDLWGGLIYYPIAEASRMFNTDAGVNDEFTAPDAEDSPFLAFAGAAVGTAADY